MRQQFFLWRLNSTVSPVLHQAERFQSDSAVTVYYNSTPDMMISLSFSTRTFACFLRVRTVVGKELSDNDRSRHLTVDSHRTPRGGTWERAMMTIVERSVLDADRITPSCAYEPSRLWTPLCTHSPPRTTLVLWDYRKATLAACASIGIVFPISSDRRMCARQSARALRR